MAQRKAASPSVAAKAFAEGQALYRAGRFREAIVAFSRAHRLSPHGSALFNVARCHENLSEPAKAIEFYRQALKLTSDAKSVLDIHQRIARLEQLPTRIFISSEPPGAKVWVDGAPNPQGETPMVLKLSAGPHLVMLRHADFEVAVQRIEVRVGKERTVHVELRRGERMTCSQPASQPQSVPCPRCRDPRLIRFEGPHVHATVLGGFMLARELGAVGGGGGLVAATIHRWRVGLYVQYMPVNPTDIGALAGTDTSTSFTMGQVEGGRVFPFGRWHLYATVGVGGYLYRLTHDNPASDEPNLARESRGVMWGFAGGVEAMISSWVSLGIGLRLGMMHGDMLRAKVVKVTDATGTSLELDASVKSGHFPYATLWGGVNFHL